MDYEIFKIINGWAGQYEWLDFTMKSISEYGPYLFAIVVALMAIDWRSEERRKAGIFAIATAVLAVGINYVIGLIYYRDRPFVVHEVTLLLDHEADFSFPSNHTAGAFSIAFVLFYYYRRWGGLFLILACLIGLARPFVGHHYPSDVLGGITVALLSSFCIIYFGEKMFAKFAARKKGQTATLKDS